jgi:hypothetical protein
MFVDVSFEFSIPPVRTGRPPWLRLGTDVRAGTGDLVIGSLLALAIVVVATYPKRPALTAGEVPATTSDADPAPEETPQAVHPGS